uniref:Protein S100 n=1 Tax=Naja naja TaxID=35670 RepID=A0A8C6XQA3_NAJNA
MSQTQMEKCCECIIDVFHKYSIQTDHHDRLSKAEFAKLLKEQLQTSSRASGDADGLFNELDENKDGQLSFKEFTTLVQEALMISYNKLHQDD